MTNGSTEKLSPIPNIEIRFATEDDAPALALLLSESFAEYEPLYTREGFAATVIAPQQILSRMQEGPVWVALRDDQIVGAASALQKTNSLYIRGMAVHPDSRGLQIGQLLLMRVETYAAGQGLRRMFLSTTPFLDRAIRLYENFGFKRTGEGPDNLFGTPLFTMEKFLD